MGKQFKGFIMGFIFACMLVVPTTALADNIQAQFNTVNVTVDGKNSVKQGENYQLSDGSIVPFSINYKGTTYLPIRKISDLLGIGISYDNTTKTVQVITNTNNTTTPQTPGSSTTTSAITTTTSYAVFNECNKDVNSNDDKVTHVIGFKDGSKLDTYTEYSYYSAISAKINSAQLWQTTGDSKGNITKVKAVSASKSGKVESSDGRNSVSVSSVNYNFEKNVVIYQWTDDDEHKVYSGNIKKDDYVNLYDTDGNKKYDVVIFTRNGKTIDPGDATTTNENTSSNTTTNNSNEKPKTASMGYSAINECLKDANDAGDKVQHIVGFLDGKKMEALTSEQNIIKAWNAPKLNSTGFSNSAIFKLSLDSKGVIVSADKVSEDIGQGTVEKANNRYSVTIGGKTYNLSNYAVLYKVTDDDEYKIYSGNMKDNDIVQLYETDSSKDGYDIVVFSRP